ncbi:DUF6747 family protein [Zobellia sp. 1_MG-2023]|uniref:DUF6747 family protein n=1 Tax=Zobellia sp. 1_MG-2023 TaxID=3062626 RepID=UPI0034C603D7
MVSLFLCPNIVPNLKIDGMRKLSLFKEIYVEAFRDLTFRMLTKYFKAYSWFCFALLILVYTHLFTACLRALYSPDQIIQLRIKNAHLG